MTDLKKAFQSAKRIGWNKSIVSLHIVHRKMKAQTRQAEYSILGVNTDDKLRKKLRSVACTAMKAATRVTQYDYSTADQDSDFLGIGVSETDMESILDQLTASQGSMSMASSIDDLVDSWIYIARLDVPRNVPLFAVRRISQGWTTKKVSQHFINSVFSNNMLIDIEQDCVFKIDSKIDFFAYNGFVFIVDKKNFEAALNFRTGMENNRDQIAQEFISAGVLAGSADFVSIIGDNMRRLRKLAQVKKSGYYKSKDFMSRLKAINVKEKWGLSYAADGTLVITDDNVDTVLRVLNNDRLRSPINQENFDVDVKHKI